MKMIPHSHFGMSGPIRGHLLIYTVVIAGALTILFDLGRIAALGAFFYLVMDMTVHWGVLRHVRREVGARVWVLLCALGFDAVVIVALATAKLRSDPLVVVYAIAGIATVFVAESLWLRRISGNDSAPD